MPSPARITPIEPKMTIKNQFPTLPRCAGGALLASALMLASCGEPKPDEIRWVHVCYESHKETDTVLVYDPALKMMLPKVRTRLVCDAHGIVCTHYDNHGDHLCDGSPSLSAGGGE